MPAKTVKAIIFRVVVENSDQKKKFKEIKQDFKSLHTTATKALSGLASVAHSAFKILQNAIKTTARSIASFVVSSIKNFANYEDILTHAARTLSLTKDEANNLGNALIDLAENALKGGIASEALARIAGVAGQLGVAKEDVLAFTETVAKMSVAFGMGAEKAAEGMQIITNIFRLNMEEMERLGSGITELGNSTAATAGQIILISQKMAGVTEFFGLTGGQTAALAATMRDLGVTVGVSASSMNRFLASIVDNYSKFAEVLSIDSGRLKQALLSNDPSEALFMVLDALNKLNDPAFGGDKLKAGQALRDLGMNSVRTKNAVLLLAGGVDRLRKNLEMEAEAEKENTAINQAYAIAINTATGRWNQFQEAISRVQKILGGPLATAFSNFLQKYITPVIQKFGDWLEKSQLVQTFLNTTLPAALDVVGQKITALANVFFNWLGLLEKGEIDFQKLKDAAYAVHKAVTAWIETNLPKLKEFSLKMFKMATDIEKVGEAFRTVKNYAKATWDVMSRLVKIFTALIEKSGRFFKDFELFGKAALSITSDLINKMMGFDEAMQAAEETSTGNSLWPDMVLWAGKAGTTIADVTQRVNELNKGLATGMQFSDISASGLEQLMRSQVLTPSGLQGVLAAQQTQLRQTSGMPQLETRRPVPSRASQAQTLNATIVMDDQEIGRFTSVISDRQTQDRQRSGGFGL